MPCSGAGVVAEAGFEPATCSVMSAPGYRCPTLHQCRPVHRTCRIARMGFGLPPIRCYPETCRARPLPEGALPHYVARLGLLICYAGGVASPPMTTCRAHHGSLHAMSREKGGVR